MVFRVGWGVEDMNDGVVVMFDESMCFPEKFFKV